MARKKRTMDTPSPLTSDALSSKARNSHATAKDAMLVPKITRGMTTDAARQAVFDTTELLESILVHLPPKSLFGVLRVSRQFQAIITTSVPIQERMFLRIRNRPQHIWLLKVTAEAPYFVEEANAPPKSLSREPADLNPFLKLRHQDLSSVERVSERITESVRLSVRKPISLSVLESKAPSVLDTHISNPPPDEIELTHIYHLPGGHVAVSAYLYNREKIYLTLRDMVCATLDGEGWARIRFKDRNSDIEWVKDEFGDVADPKRVIQYYESILRSKLDGTQGFRTVELSAHGIIVPTEAERAAVKSGKAQV